MVAPQLEKLRHFTHEVGRLHREHHQTTLLLDVVAQRSTALVCYDDWLSEEYALPHPHRYQQYLLRIDSGECFSIINFVWGPGQTTPIHGHRVWGATGMLRGTEENQCYQLDADSILHALGAATLLEVSQVEEVSADDGGIHRVSNTLTNRIFINIRIYGGGIDAMKYTVCTPEGQQKPFTSGYSNRYLPNIWGLSHEHQG